MKQQNPAFFTEGRRTTSKFIENGEKPKEDAITLSVQSNLDETKSPMLYIQNGYSLLN